MIGVPLIHQLGYETECRWIAAYRAARLTTETSRQVCFKVEAVLRVAYRARYALCAVRRAVCSQIYCRIRANKPVVLIASSLSDLANRSEKLGNGGHFWADLRKMLVTFDQKATKTGPSCRFRSRFLLSPTGC